jgi:putative ABC transport system permease protein
MVMRALDRKLWRDLWHLRGMVMAISLVLLGGISTFLMSRVTYESLAATQQRYYVDQRFADLFAGLVRAPEAVAERLAAIPGVNHVETRVVAAVNLEVEGYDDPVTAKILSLPEHGKPLLNVPWLRIGRLPDPYADSEVTVSEDFAEAQDLEPGDRLIAIVKGRRKQLTIVGLALSPEYMYAIPPGAIFPDHERYGILWMNRRALATAFEMEGAFNDASFSLQRGVNPQDVIDAIDALLARYGGLGAYARKDQFSHRFISEELRQLATLATVFPVIFLGVSAFLLNVVITRLISLERDQIGTLKAFGYGTAAITAHYVKLVLAMVAPGLVAGAALGLWFARAMAGLYQVFYSFPYLHLVLEPEVFVQALAVAMAAALAGTLLAVRRAAAMPPAEAMRPEPPPIYRATTLERAGLARRVAEPTRMILRHVARRLLKAGLTTLGIAAAVSILMITNFQRDAVGWMVGVQYVLSSREDMTVMFTEPTPRRALYSLAGLQGVGHVEGFRAVPARLVHGHRSYRTAVEGVEPGAELQRPLDAELRPVPIPADGIVLTEYLARDMLAIEPGQTLVIEVLEGRRPVLEVPVAGVTRQYLGVNAYMDREALNRLMLEGPAISGARVAVDPARQVGLYRELREMPRVAGTVVRENSIRQFNEMMEETILFFSFITALLGGFIAFGVVYNSARIALSERGRELASLRVLGFTRAEVGYILLGEIGLLTLMAVPLGFVLGRALSAYLAASFTSDLYRVPLIVEPATYALAASVVLASFAVSAAMIWRRIARLDLVEVLKTRE